jgi:hypothetical protein
MGFYVVLKNSILLALIILIVHFMVINDLLENEYIHNKKTEQEQSIKLPIEEEVPKSLIIQTKLSCLNSTKNNAQTKKTVTNANPLDEIDKFFPKAAVDTSDIKMKELYDFVYDDNTDDNLDTLFNSTIETPNVNTEIDKHHEIIQDTQIPSTNSDLCDYEIVGDLSDKTNEPFAGIDMTCQTFSKTI